MGDSLWFVRNYSLIVIDLEYLLECFLKVALITITVYRDDNAFYALVEYRQMISAGDETKFKKILSKLGFAAWAGMGTIGPDFKNWSEIMPNFGAELRIEVQPRMNFRIDVGGMTLLADKPYFILI